MHDSRTMRAVAVGVVMLAALAFTAGAWGDPGETQFFTSLYEDHRASKPGDILFVVVSESATASHQATRANDKSSEVATSGGTAWLRFIPGLSYGGDMSASASGSSRRTDMLSARVAVTISGITPEGNLQITGERTVRVNRDFQTIRLVGEVRPEDVRPDNTVLSQHVANASIEYEGPDPGRPGRRVGIITRILGWLF